MLNRILLILCKSAAFLWITLKCVVIWIRVEAIYLLPLIRKTNCTQIMIHVCSDSPYNASYRREIIKDFFFHSIPLSLILLVVLPTEPVKNVGNQQDATISVYWSFKINSTCFGRQTAADRWPFDKITGRQQYRCIAPQAVHTVKKCSWGWASLSPETCRADLKRSINIIFCIF